MATKAKKNKVLMMDTTTIGYSKDAIKTLKGYIGDTIKKQADIIDPNVGDAYKLLRQDLDDYWDGNDYDNFVADIKAMATGLAGELRSYKSQLERALDDYANEFGSFQNSVYSKNTIKLKK